MKFHRIIFIALCFGIQLTAFSQVGINTSSPNASAQLDVTASNKGFLPPRVALTSITDNSTISSPANGLLIYNTSSAGSSTNAVTPGYYYFDGSKWQRLINHDKQTTKHTVLINNVAASTSSLNGPTNVSNWTGTYSASGGDVVVTASFSAFTTNTNFITFRLMRDGNSVASRNFYFNNTSIHHTLPTIYAVFENESGSHTYGIRVESGIIIDSNDFCSILVTESNIP